MIVMTTVNYSVPEQVKREFNKIFADKNKSQIITELMQRAINEHYNRVRRSKAIDKLLELRDKAPAISSAEIRKLREDGRK